MKEDIKKAAEEQIEYASQRIDSYIVEYNIEILALKMEQGEYIVPDYQREFTWEEKRKSRFIESLIMGLPIPYIFFWENDDGRLEIVDGSQRLRTIHEFIYKGLKLQDLEVISNLNGYGYEDLFESRQRKIKNRSIRGIVLNNNTSQDARLDMFDRINTGSKNANPAEIRRGVLQGPFMDLVTELSAIPQFEELAPLTKAKKKLRLHEELVTRIFAYGDGLDDYRDNPSEFLFNYSKAMNKKFEEGEKNAEDYRKRFLAIIDFVDEVFPFGFKKSAKATTTYNSRFEAIALGVDKFISKYPEDSKNSREKFHVDEWVSSDDFTKKTGSDGANAIKRLKDRIDYVYSRLVSDVSSSI